MVRVGAVGCQVSGSSFGGNEVSAQVPRPNVQVGGSSGSADLAPRGAGVFPQGEEVMPVVGWPDKDTGDDASLDEFPHRQLPVPLLERIPLAVVFEDTSSDEASSNEEGERLPSLL